MPIDRQWRADEASRAHRKQQQLSQATFVVTLGWREWWPVSSGVAKHEVQHDGKREEHGEPVKKVHFVHSQSSSIL